MVQIPAEEVHLLREIVVQAEVDVVVFQGLGHVRAQADGVHAVAEARVVAFRHHVPELRNRGAGSDAARVATKISARAASGRCREVIDLSVDDQIAGLQGIGRDDAGNLNRLRKAAHFVISEEERPVLL